MGLPSWNLLNGKLCNYVLFVVCFIGYSILYTVIWMYITSIKEFLKNIDVHLKTICNKRKDGGGDKGEDNLTLANECTGDERLSVSGVIKIVISFYQISSLLHVELPKTSESNTSFMNAARNNFSDIKY